MAQTTSVFLLGKTGAGKSATGNSILGRKCFETGASTSSITERSTSEFADFQGRSIRVVDGPGLGDTRLDNENAAKRCITSIENAMKMTDSGFDAFLLVFRFGARFTQEEKETIQFMKTVFGDDLLRKFGIIVMTCGDSFERESAETGKTFQNWCQEQVGVFQELYRECQHRAIIFNNVNNTGGKRDTQVGELLKTVDSLAYSGNKYTAYEFNMNSLGRNKVIVQSMKSSILKQVTVEATEISKELKKIQEWKPNEGQVGHLEQLHSRSEQLVSKVKSQDMGTGVLSDIVDMLMPTQRSINEALVTQQKVITEMARLKRIEEERKRQAEESRRQQEEMRRRAEEQRKAEERRRAEEREAARRRQEEEERRARQREEELRRQLEEERERTRQREAELERARQEAAAARPRSRSPPVEKKVVREVGRVVNQIGRIFRF